MELFPQDKRIGVFRGFREGGYEFHADLVLPYKSEFQNIPMHGQFLLVQLETPDEAVLGRISSLASEGKLSLGAGEEFNLRAMKENRDVPEDLREQYLKYKVNIRVLGVVRKSGGRLTFVPSHRRLPHVGSPVAFPSDEALREIAGHNIEGAGIGFFALGEYIYSGGSDKVERLPWMQIKQPEVEVKFSIRSLVARRTFIFARAGFGKSSLNKLLFSELYKETPTVEKRGGRKVPVGTIIFDPDGEYFWPDDKNRPGLCDVPALEDKLVVFTSRSAPSKFYQSFVAGGIKLDVRRLRPADVVAIAVAEEKQDQQNIRKLKALSPQRWAELVDLIAAAGNSADLGEICRLLELDEQRSDMEANAARSNMTAIVNTLHDKSSQMLDLLLTALRAGKLCVVDVSQMRGGQSLVLSGIILRYIFDNNQREFTNAEPRTIPTIAVIEEAQSVLNDTATSAEPYIAWVKEGRKYDLGALLVTQQPGSIPSEILSQGDNWFLFHLLSAGDLSAVRKANAHFSDDLLSSLLNEPIPGQGVFWSSVGGTPYPVALRALSFERLNMVQDPNYRRAAGNTFARELLRQAEATRAAGRRAEQGLAAEVPAEDPLADDFLDEPLPVRPRSRGNGTGHTPFTANDVTPSGANETDGDDALADLRAIAAHAVQQENNLIARIRSAEGVVWWEVQRVIKDALPETLADRHQTSYEMVAPALERIFGNEGWDTYRNPSKGNRTYIRVR